jgi:hypothetical protein
MIIFINDSPKKHSKQARAIIGRYCWRIARDVWIWRRSSIRNEIEQCLKDCIDPIRVIAIWKDSNSELGFSFKQYGELSSRQTHFGIFNCKAPLMDKSDGNDD